MANSLPIHRRNGKSAYRAFINWIEGTEPELSPSWTSGSGVPTASLPKGSFYTRTGGSGAGQVLYVATDSVGTWVALAETAATDTLAESTPGSGVTVDGLLIKDGDALFVDNDKVQIGTGADIVLAWDATRLNVTQAAVNSEWRWGVDGAGIDQMWYGDTASAYLNWDQSADALVFGGAASARGLRTSSTTAAAITGATVLTLADAGGVFSVSQAAAYDIDLPSPTTGPGCKYVFYLTGAAANAVTITVLGGAATFVGTIVNDVTSVIPATGATLTFGSGAAALGDSIEIISISTSLYLVRAVTSAASGITIT